MRFLRVGVGFSLIIGVLITIGLNPQTTSAAEVLVDGDTYDCTRDGLASAIAAAATTDTDTPALQIDAGLTAIGVILGGYGSHCAFDGGSLTTPFTISNDSSCGLTGQSLHLGPPSTATVNGVEQTYYPLLEASPALNAGSPTCDTTVDDDSDSDPDQLGYPRPNIGNCSIGAIESENLPPSIDPSTSPFTIYEGESLTFTVSDTDRSFDSLDSTIDCDTSDLSGPVSGLSCIYPDNGDFSGQIYVSDGYTSNTAIFTVAVTNLAPANVSITPGATLTIVNEPLEIHFSATDVTADTLQFTYNCGDANVLTTPFVSSTTGTFTTSITCQFPQPSSYILHALATDDDGGQSVEVTSVPILVGIPSSLCANNWNGALHMIDDGGECGRSETLIALPWDGPHTLCVNQRNGATHADLHNSGCGRGEQTLTATGAGNIDVCVNQWNGTLRVSNRCSRSEYADML